MFPIASHIPMSTSIRSFRGARPSEIFLNSLLAKIKVMIEQRGAPKIVGHKNQEINPSDRINNPCPDEVIGFWFAGTGCPPN